MSVNLTDPDIAQIHFENLIHNFTSPDESTCNIKVKCPFIPDKIIIKNIRVSGLLINGILDFFGGGTPGDLVDSWVRVMSNFTNKPILASVYTNTTTEGNTYTNLARNTYNDTFNFRIVNDAGALYELNSGDTDHFESGTLQLSICFIRYSN